MRRRYISKGDISVKEIEMIGCLYTRDIDERGICVTRYLCED